MEGVPKVQPYHFRNIHQKSILAVHLLGRNEQATLVVQKSSIHRDNQLTTHHTFFRLLHLYMPWNDRSVQLQTPLGGARPRW